MTCCPFLLFVGVLSNCVRAEEEPVCVWASSLPAQFPARQDLRPLFQGLTIGRAGSLSIEFLEGPFSQEVFE
jgi:hypothetical protein